MGRGESEAERRDRAFCDARAPRIGIAAGSSLAAQIEIHAGKHFVRPRYEVIAKDGRFAHRPPQCRAQRSEDRSELSRLGDLLGKGHILPAAILPVERYATPALPTPMSTAQTHMPVKALVYRR